MKTLKYYRIWIVAAVCTVGVALSGCSFKRSPEATTSQFMEALRRADEPAVRSLMTRAARERTNKPLDLGHKDTMQYTLGQPTVHDDTASVPVTIHDNGKTDSITVKMKQDEGEWRVYALGFAVAPGSSEITFDMEHPDALFADIFRGLGEGMGAMFKGMGEGMGAMMKGLGEGVQGMNGSSHNR